MTNLTADQDLFRGRISGKLSLVRGVLEEVDDLIRQYNATCPGTILEGDRTTITQAAMALRTVLKGIDEMRGVRR